MAMARSRKRPRATDPFKRCVYIFRSVNQADGVYVHVKADLWTRLAAHNGGQNRGM